MVYKKSQNANKNQNKNPHFKQFCVNIMPKIMLGIPHEQIRDFEAIN